MVQLVFENAEIDRGSHAARIHHTRVHSDHQRRGIGTALMDAAEAEAQSRGYEACSLGVAPDNEGAIRFYQQRGYRKVADYMGEKGDPLIAVSKVLT